MVDGNFFGELNVNAFKCQSRLETNAWLMDAVPKTPNGCGGNISKQSNLGSFFLAPIWQHAALERRLDLL